jgi:hypothetical protein
MAKNSAPVNRNRTPSKACFTKNSSKFQMPLNSKVVCLNILHIFCDNPPRKIPYYRLRPIHFGH